MVSGDCGVTTGDREELYRRLNQARRFDKEALDGRTKDAVRSLINELERHVAEIETKRTDDLD